MPSSSAYAAFNVRTDLADRMPALFAYVENGGNLIEQYNRPDGLKTDKFAPYDLTLSGLRVTDETAPVTLLAPDNPVLNVPNKNRFLGLRGMGSGAWYLLSESVGQPLYADSGVRRSRRGAVKGGLLVAPYGKEILSTRVSCGFASFPPGFLARIGFSRICSRWGNEHERNPTGASRCRR